MTTAGTEIQASEAGPVGPACVMVIFGASGDLAKRKLIPAIYNLAKRNLLPREFAIVGVAREEMSTDGFRHKFRSEIQEFATASIESDIWEWIEQRLYYLSGDFDNPQIYNLLGDSLAHADKQHGTQGNYLFYLATAPSFFSRIIQQLGVAGLTHEKDGCWRRVIVEKPFGRDLESARSLNEEILQVLHERQIYRIDHYLGKETVQNILAFRFGNGIFEPIWNRRYIDHVQITASETVGVEQRGGYYEGSGALRDMVPNHLFQLVTLIAMEPPLSFDADPVRNEQAKILHAIPQLTPEEVLHRCVRGQYEEGKMDGVQVPGYRTEPGIASDSNTESFVAFKLNIDNWRWADVPFYIRTGKRLAKRITEIAIQFRRAPFMPFRKTAVEKLTPNLLVLRIHPDEGISLRFGAKVPGPVVRLGAVDMAFEYADYFGCTVSTGYERLLYDCMCGDAALFQRADMVEAGWRVVTSVLDVWKALPPRSFPNYPAGTWGPPESDQLLERDGRHWRLNDE
ncbi:glucose-6-phosphate dehydrogenase [Candidatus Nitronereus thalassa]|uniref:Glucose-6-phosphate 1-dehydrogenase n=1 Tax=Candidatus Nitronereus thalassa TaxID=3020898 RepID=A0ABU3K2W4_9BACT|nr:glucose-6-phosphate dehydrogenase [Candidatus Nitronereus thalassa]MDT7040730.1 glucose-6-phosphate dehydrogenase [Candidatus Nitronereus thalassa]